MKILSFTLFSVCVSLGFDTFAQVSGTKLWEISLGNYVFSSPAIARDGTIFVGVCSAHLGDPLSPNGWIYSISPQGTTNWSARTIGDLRSSPALGPDGSVYVGSVLGNVYSFSPGGATNWVLAVSKSSNLYPGFIGSSSAVGVAGTVYVNVVSGYEPGVSYRDQLYSLHPDGKTNWVLVLNSIGNNQVDSICFSSPTIGPDGTIYVATRDRRLYEICPAGTTNWSASLAAHTYASPAIGPDGTIYLGAEEHQLHGFDPFGREKGTYPTSTPSNPRRQLMGKRFTSARSTRRSRPWVLTENCAGR